MRRAPIDWPWWFLAAIACGNGSLTDSNTIPESVFGSYVLDSVVAARVGTWDGHEGWFIRADQKHCGAATEEYVASHRVVDTLFLERTGSLQLDSIVYRGEVPEDSTFSMFYRWHSVCYDRDTGRIINNDGGPLFGDWRLYGRFAIGSGNVITFALAEWMTYAASQTRIGESHLLHRAIRVFIDDLQGDKPERQCNGQQCVVDGYRVNQDIELIFTRP